ncbi:MAG TPA: VWA domain-containing protein, partial [Abditibacteriaceae bacterium]|nr:VWA domain-containing protein [Abditibacteriaceae bacterium]
ACNLLLGQLKPEDRAAVSVFSSGARTIVPSQKFDDSVKRLAQREVSQLQIEGATEIMAGLNQVYAEVAPHRSPDVTTFVILLSDGEPTDSQGYRVKSLDQFLQRTDAEFKTNGVSLSTIGLGGATDYDAAFLRDLADKGSGKFLMSKQPNELADAFQDEFGRIQSTVLSDVSIEVHRLNGTVRRFWRVVPDKKIFDPPKVTDGSFRIAVGSIQNDQPQAYLVDVVTGTPAETSGRGMLCQVAAVVVANGVENRAETNVLTGYSDNELELTQRNGEVLKLNEEAIDFKLQMDLEDAVKTGDKRKMTSVLERKKKMTQRLGKTTATKVLDDMQATLQGGGDIAADDLAVSSAESKKTKRLG